MPSHNANLYKVSVRETPRSLGREVARLVLLALALSAVSMAGVYYMFAGSHPVASLMGLTTNGPLRILMIFVGCVAAGLIIAAFAQIFVNLARIDRMRRRNG